MMDYHQNWQRREFMRPGMYGAGDIVGTGTMGSGIMMRMIFTLMDGDGDGTVSSQEFQAAHERIFRGMDANKDGRLTVEEIQAFMQGPRRSLPRSKLNTPVDRTRGAPLRRDHELLARVR